MYLFCGNSDVRQFRLSFAGSFHFSIFSGATIKGLMNDDARFGHGAVTRHLASLPVSKTIFLVFGCVDLDFSYYRQAALAKGEINSEEFASERIQVYNRFLGRMLDENEGLGRVNALRVLAPQATPLKDEYFYPTTSLQTGVPEHDFRAISEKVDLSQNARNVRIVAFNDSLEQNLIRHPLIKFYRIDRYMLDHQGELKSRFYNKRAFDHHANTNATISAWALHMHADIPKLSAMANKERQSDPDAITIGT